MDSFISSEHFVKHDICIITLLNREDLIQMASQKQYSVPQKYPFSLPHPFFRSLFISSFISLSFHFITLPFSHSNVSLLPFSSLYMALNIVPAPYSSILLCLDLYIPFLPLPILFVSTCACEHTCVCACVCVCACAFECACAYACACVRACVCVIVYDYIDYNNLCVATSELNEKFYPFVTDDDDVSSRSIFCCVFGSEYRRNSDTQVCNKT